MNIFGESLFFSPLLLQKNVWKPRENDKHWAFLGLCCVFYHSFFARDFFGVADSFWASNHSENAFLRLCVHEIIQSCLVRFAKREHCSFCIWMLKRCEDFSPHIVFVTGIIHKWQFATSFEIPFGPEPLMDIPPPSLAQKFLVIPTFAGKNVGWLYLPWGRSIFPCLSETWVMGQNRRSKSQV